jgi:hypothetical protein
MKITDRRGLLGVLCSILVGFLSCGSPVEKEGDDNKTNAITNETGQATSINTDIKGLPVPGMESNDTVYLSGSYILFFGPTTDEMNSMVAEGNVPPGYNDLIVESDRLRRSMQDTLSVMDLSIGLSYSEASIVCITMDEGNRMYFNRRNLKFPSGMIMMDGMQPPAIRSSNSTLHDYMQFVRNYFVNVTFPETDKPNT